MVEAAMSKFQTVNDAPCAVSWQSGTSGESKTGPWVFQKTARVLDRWVRKICRISAGSSVTMATRGQRCGNNVYQTPLFVRAWTVCQPQGRSKSLHAFLAFVLLWFSAQRCPFREFLFWDRREWPSSMVWQDACSIKLGRGLRTVAAPFRPSRSRSSLCLHTVNAGS
ncbi:uncharacterized protein LY79DRAFT_228257 [Colletotrichum navitas]|uniref:Uncharacterized protein n=1 Tax=Colletotrichum navitas TaxID=681940 RepID=A0AAD8PXR8_9PEZI|nr:uncharacterized protein LY79DRAFT_228257 [Colletotrichum navitas]KAK1590054.1 hypothetical protein LY79DRAFT_228257 [Colletotrichum navitas]